MLLGGSRKCRRCGAAIIDVRGSGVPITKGAICASCRLIDGKDAWPSRPAPARPSPGPISDSNAPAPVAKQDGARLIAGAAPPRRSDDPSLSTAARQLGIGCAILLALLVAISALSIFLGSAISDRQDEIAVHTSGGPRPVPSNNPGGWVTAADYPVSALRAEHSGTSRFTATVDKNGRVSDCTITQSSGDSDLDRAVCKAVTARARFNPAEGADGNAIAGTYSNSVRWQIPE